MIVTPLQLPSVHHNPFCDRGYTFAMLNRIKWEQRVWSTEYRKDWASSGPGLGK